MLIRFLFCAKCRFAWIGLVVSAVMAKSAETKENEELAKQQAREEQNAAEANKIEMTAYHREKQMEERQQKFDENKEQYGRWQNMINKAPKLKQNLIDIWKRNAA